MGKEPWNRPAGTLRRVRRQHRRQQQPPAAARGGMSVLPRPSRLRGMLRGEPPPLCLRVHAEPFDGGRPCRERRRVANCAPLFEVDVHGHPRRVVPHAA